VYASVRRYEGNAGLADELSSRADEVRIVVGGIPGFRAYYLLRTGDGVTTVSVFDDEAGAAESTRAAGAWVAENLADMAIAPPQVTTGEVALSF